MSLFSGYQKCSNNTPWLCLSPSPPKCSHSLCVVTFKLKARIDLVDGSLAGKLTPGRRQRQNIGWRDEVRNLTRLLQKGDIETARDVPSNVTAAGLVDIIWKRREATYQWKGQTPALSESIWMTM